MRLTVLGGGGVRSPYLARSIVRQARRLGIEEVVFMDDDPERLRIFGGLSREVARRIDPSVGFTLTTDPVAALRDADAVITTLRVGQDEGRIRDERIALSQGLLGQETTGAGGFAMALRSIPVLMEYCRLVRTHARPGAPVFNFTNPSGLVTQALRSAGYDTVYGICDGPSGFLAELERLLGAAPGDVDVECYGLNHLSWYRSVRLRDQEILPGLLSDPDLYRRTEMRLFRPDLARDLGLLFNGYLYYYYHREEAIAHILQEGTTRGEAIARINRRLQDDLSDLDATRDYDRATSFFLAAHAARSGSYMAIESGAALHPAAAALMPLELAPDDGGYAGVALGLLAALRGEKSGDRPFRMVLSVPNEGSIEGLADDDVVEVSCEISSEGVRPIRIGAPPEVPMSLIRPVKLYERLAVQAIAERSRVLARRALMVHPLVNSYSLADRLVADYLEAHAEHVGEWA